MYRYLNIRGASDYSVFLPVAGIQEVLKNFPELAQSSDRTYDSDSCEQWLSLSIVGCDSNGNFPAGISQAADTANLVELICSDSDPKNRAFYERLALGIAKALGWEVINGGTGERIHKIEPA